MHNRTATHPVSKTARLVIVATLLGLPALSALAGCGGDGCKTSADCPKITCKDGYSAQACIMVGDTAACADKSTCDDHGGVQ